MRHLRLVSSHSHPPPKRGSYACGVSSTFCATPCRSPFMSLAEQIGAATLVAQALLAVCAAGAVTAIILCWMGKLK